MPKPASSGPRVIFYDIPETERAWAAGFLDGEGTFWFSGSSARARPGRDRAYGTFKIQAAQVERLSLDRLQAALGAGRVYGPYLSKQANRRPVYQFAAAGVEAAEAFGRIRQFLSPVKRQQGEDALAGYSAQLSRPKLVGRPTGGRMALREQRVAEIASAT
jgi:hypothetical protein